VSIRQLKAGRIKGLLQDGSREFISLLACVSATGKRMSPSLIYSSESGDLQSSWLDQFDPKDQSTRCYFGSSETGWTNNNLALAWLARFAKETATNQYAKRLLLVDGHGSHVNRSFIDLALAAGILIVVLPPHSTHRLQPLDVSVFRPLAQAYSEELDNFMHNSYGFSSVTKAVFWQIFWPAWDKSVCDRNIISGFKKSGIWPLDPTEILSQMAIQPQNEPQSSESESDDNSSPPTDVRDVRHLTKLIQNEPEPHSQAVATLIDSAELLSIQNEILRHDVGRLQSTLIHERHRKIKGKAIGLLTPTQTKFGQFYSPERIQVRRDKEVAQMEQDSLKKAAQIEEKIQKQLQKEQREQENKERIQKNKEERAKKKAQKETDLAARRRQRELAKQQKEQAKEQKQTSKRRPKQRHVLANAIALDLELFEAEEEIISVSRSGRAITLPTRFIQ
jgi:hypothetical protein